MTGHRNILRLAGWAAAATLLLIPLVAMQVTDAVAWTLFDFVVAAILIAAAGAVVEVVVRRLDGRAARLTAVAAVTALFALIWAGLATA